MFQFLSKILTSRKNQLDPRNDKYYDTQSGLVLSANTAAHESTVYSCVRVLSDSLAQLPLKLINEVGGVKKRALENPLYNLLLYSPNQWQTAFDYWKYNVQCLCYKGFFLSKIIKSTNGKIVGLNPYNPNFTKLIPQRDGRLVFKSISVQNVALGRYDLVETIEKDEAFYCYYMTSDGINPTSPISANRETVNLSSTMRTHAKKLFENEALPPGSLEVPYVLKEDAFQRLKESWKQMVGGNNRGSIAILEKGIKYNKLSMSNEDAQYLETRRYTKEEICGIFGVPPHMIGDSTQAKGWSTLEQQMSEYLVLSLNPFLVRIEKAIRFCLIPRQSWKMTYANFEAKSLLRADVKARKEYQQFAIEHGVLNPNEVRELEDLNAREGGDEYWMPLNFTTGDEQETNTEELTDEHK